MERVTRVAAGLQVQCMDFLPDELAPSDGLLPSTGTVFHDTSLFGDNLQERPPPPFPTPLHWQLPHEHLSLCTNPRSCMHARGGRSGTRSRGALCSACELRNCTRLYYLHTEGMRVQ